MNFQSPYLLDFVFSSGLLIVSLFILIITSLQLIVCQDLLKNTILLSIFSIFTSLCYLLMDSPDVAMTESALGACLSTMIFLTIIRKFKINHTIHQGNSSYCFKNIFALVLCVMFIITLTYIGLQLPLYGEAISPVNSHLSKYYLENTAIDIGIPSVVAAILASYRGFDTLGETTVILIAGLSVVLILSKKEEEIKDEEV